MNRNEASIEIQEISLPSFIFLSLCLFLQKQPLPYPYPDKVWRDHLNDQMDLTTKQPLYRPGTQFLKITFQF